MALIIRHAPRFEGALRALWTAGAAVCAGTAALAAGTVISAFPLAAAAAGCLWCAFLAPPAVCGAFRVTCSRGQLAVERGWPLRRCVFLPAGRIRRIRTSRGLFGLFGLGGAAVVTPSGTVRLRGLSPEDAAALRAFFADEPVDPAEAAPQTAAKPRRNATPPRKAGFRKEPSPPRKASLRQGTCL